MSTDQLFEQPEKASNDADFYARLIREEAEAVLELLPHAHAREWSASPVPRPREDTSQRTIGDLPSDPTGDIALDPRRLAVRDTVARSTKALHDAAVALRGARRAMERAIRWYDGEVS